MKTKNNAINLRGQEMSEQLVLIEDAIEEAIIKGFPEVSLSKKKKHKIDAVLAKQLSGFSVGLA